jgi:hypothetical protein
MALLERAPSVLKEKMYRACKASKGNEGSHWLWCVDVLSIGGLVDLKMTITAAV